MNIQPDFSNLPEIYLLPELDLFYGSTFGIKTCGGIPNLDWEQCGVLQKYAPLLFKLSEDLNKQRKALQKLPPLKEDEHEQFNKIVSDIDYVNQQRQVLHWFLLSLCQNGGGGGAPTGGGGGGGIAGFAKKVNLNPNKSSSSDSTGGNDNKNKEEEDADSALGGQKAFVSTALSSSSLPDDLKKLVGMVNDLLSYQGSFAAVYYKPFASVTFRILFLLAGGCIEEAKQLYLKNKSLFHSIYEIRNESDANPLFAALNALITAFEDRGVSLKIN